MASNLLEHKGVVSAIDEKLIEVEFVAEGACASCKAKGLCGVDEGDKRFVVVHEPMAEYYSVGEEVMVGVSEQMGIKAATYAYILPFFVLLGGLLLTLSLLGWSDLAGGLSALGLMCVYYFVLWFFRRRIEKDIVFKIRKL